MSRTIEMSDETYERLKDQLSEDEKVDVSSVSDFVGKKMFFRAVTYHMLGRVKKVIGKILFLERASWIADSGRFMDFIKNGVNEKTEVEPVGDWFVNLDTCSDFCIWKHDLPTKQQ